MLSISMYLYMYVSVFVYHDSMRVAVGIAVFDKLYVPGRQESSHLCPSQISIANDHLQPAWQLPDGQAGRRKLHPTSAVSSSREQRRVGTGSMSSIVRAADAGEGIKNGRKDSKPGSLRESSKNTYSSTSLHEYGGDQVQRKALQTES